MTDSSLFASERPTRLFLRCSVPSVLVALAGALYSVVDGILLGHFLGEDALAAVSIVMPAIMAAEALANMIAAGSGVCMGIFLGSGRQQDASRVFSCALRCIFASSCALGVCGFALAEPFVRLIAGNASEQAIGYACQYLRVYALFSPLVPVFFAMDNFLRVCGRPKTCMVLNISSQLLNVVLSYALIAVFGLGVTGAALGSCIAIAAGSAASLSLFATGRLDVGFTREGIPVRLLLSILANGSSEFFGSLSISVTSVIVNVYLLRLGGTTAVAAFSILSYADSMVGMITFELSEALQPAISYCYGAKLFERMKMIVRRVLFACGALGAASFLLMFFAGPQIASLFIRPEDTALLAQSSSAMKIFAFSYIIGWVDASLASYFTAINRPLRSLAVSVFGTFVFPLAFLALLTLPWGLDGVWLTAPAAASSSALLALGCLLTMKEKPS
jgi:putative MATE family efflux protein